MNTIKVGDKIVVKNALDLVLAMMEENIPATALTILRDCTEGKAYEVTHSGVGHGLCKENEEDVTFLDDAGDTVMVHSSMVNLVN